MIPCSFLNLLLIQIQGFPGNKIKKISRDFRENCRGKLGDVGVVVFFFLKSPEHPAFVLYAIFCRQFVFECSLFTPVFDFSKHRKSPNLSPGLIQSQKKNKKKNKKTMLSQQNAILLLDSKQNTWCLSQFGTISFIKALKHLRSSYNFGRFIYNSTPSIKLFLWCRHYIIF